MVIKDIVKYVGKDLYDCLRKMGVGLQKSLSFKQRLLDEYNTIPVIISSEPYKESTRSIADFKDIKLPFESMFIEFHNEAENVEIGLHLTTNNVFLAYGADYYFAVYKSDGKSMPVIQLAAYIRKDRLPRLYGLCVDPCSYLNESSTVDFKKITPICMKTERVAHCEGFAEVFKYFKYFIDIVDKINNPSYEVVSSPVSTPHRKSYTQRQATGYTQSIIYLNKRRVYTTSDGGGRGKRTPKCPHLRRGHYRHYKSGKVVWVNEIQIHGAKQTRQKIYKI